MCVCTCIFIGICIGICICICIGIVYVYVYIDMYTYVYMCVSLYIYTYIHTDIITLHYVGNQKATLLNHVIACIHADYVYTYMRDVYTMITITTVIIMLHYHRCYGFITVMNIVITAVSLLCALLLCL